MNPQQFFELKKNTNHEKILKKILLEKKYD